jgi:hypothetical protein
MPSPAPTSVETRIVVEPFGRATELITRLDSCPAAGDRPVLSIEKTFERAVERVQLCVNFCLPTSECREKMLRKEEAITDDIILSVTYIKYTWTVYCSPRYRLVLDKIIDYVLDTLGSSLIVILTV